MSSTHLSRTVKMTLRQKITIAAMPAIRPRLENVRYVVLNRSPSGSASIQNSNGRPMRVTRSGQPSRASIRAFKMGFYAYVYVQLLYYITYSNQTSILRTKEHRPQVNQIVRNGTFCIIRHYLNDQMQNHWLKAGHLI